MFSKTLKFIALWLVVYAVSAAAFTPQFADANKTLRIRWKNPTIRIGLSTSLDKQKFNLKSQAEVEEIVNRSLKTWEEVTNIKFVTFWTEKQSISPAGSAGDGVSLITIGETAENIEIFGDDWLDVSAQTRTFFNRRGLITEADIVLNPLLQFSTDGVFGTFDLESVLTHEIGHLLGLEHSFVMGATMYARQGKNGVYGLSAFSPRTLAEDDLTGIRALYGAKNPDDACCGEIRGKLTLPNGKAARDYQVWAEESESGRVVSGVWTDAFGEFLFDGLTEGEYRVFAQKTNEKSDKSLSTEEVGTVRVKNRKTAELNAKLQLKSNPFNLQFVGFNGQISELAVPVNGGKSYIIYIGGKNLELENLEMSFSSPNISVVPNSRIKYDYGANISIVSFEVKISKNTPLGEYGIFVNLRDERITCLAGSLTVEEFPNHWNNNIFDKE